MCLMPPFRRLASFFRTLRCTRIRWQLPTTEAAESESCPLLSSLVESMSRSRSTSKGVPLPRHDLSRILSLPINSEEPWEVGF